MKGNDRDERHGRREGAGGGACHPALRGRVREHAGGQPRQLTESVVNGAMSAGADRLCEATGNGRDGYRERGLVTCVGTRALRIPRARTGSFFPDDATAC